jgi:hypothetical protein
VPRAFLNGVTNPRHERRAAAASFMRSEHDGTLDNMKNFLDCVRSRKMPNAPIQAGVEAARTSWIGIIAFKRGMKTVFDAAKGKVVS